MPPNRGVLPCVLCDANTQSAPAIGTAEFSCYADDHLLIRNFCQINEACTEKSPQRVKQPQKLLQARASLKSELAYQSDTARVAGEHGLRNVEVRTARRKVALIAGTERVE